MARTEDELPAGRAPLVGGTQRKKALALNGRPLPVTKNRGPARFGEREGHVTVHPSYLLRIRDPDERHAAYAQFVEDLRRVRALSGQRKQRRAAG